MKTIYKGYDIETDTDAKITGVTKNGKSIENTFDNLLTVEAVMEKIDTLTGKKDKTKEPKGSVAYDNNAEYDWSVLDEKTLRSIYAQMQKTGRAKLADLEAGMKLDEMRATCKNVHNYFRVRSTEAKVTNQQTKAKKAATKQETDTMAKTTKKTSKKIAPKKATPKVEKFAGYPLDAKVTVLNQKNPAREGGAKYKRWEVVLSKSHKTIADLKKAKANPGTVRNAVKAKSIKVTV